MTDLVMNSTRNILSDLNACKEAIGWVGDRPPEQAWRECPRGDWLLWIAAKLGVDCIAIVRAACECARTALQYVPKGEDRPRLAIEAAEAWCENPTGKTDAAAYAAYDAADDVAYAAADAAAYAAYARAHVAIVRKHITWKMIKELL